MAYFTTLLQRQVNDVWRQKIEAADRQMRLCTSGKAIRDFLNDRTTLNTVGFVIRRHLQNTSQPLLDSISFRTSCGYSDLTQNLNVPWPEPFINELSNELFRISKSRGVSISKITWTRYLSDAPNKMYKDTPFKVAFSLQMNVETTEELLMACGQDSYCLRKPEHFIYYYAQMRSNYYSWTRAQSLVDRFNKQTEGDGTTPGDAAAGMTGVLRRDLKDLFNNSCSDDKADEALIAYMLQHRAEFSGLSISNREDFLRMAQYLVVLYPTYTKVSKKKNPFTGETEENALEFPVTLLENGVPQLSELVRALFNTGGWLPTSYSKPGTTGSLKRTASSLVRRAANDNIEYKRAPIDEEFDQPFLNSVQYFVDSYAHHLDAIDRVFRCPANPGSVERRDVILFTYFFIRKYPELLLDENIYGNELDSLTQLAYGDSRIDHVMDDIMDQLYDIVNGDSSEKDTILDYLGIFNDVLRAFGMKGMYMPNPWDRFIYMSLFAEDPDFFTEAVLWNTISDDNNESEAFLTEELNPTTKQLKDCPIRRNLLIPYPGSMPIKTGTNESEQEYTVAYIRRMSNDEYITINKCSYIAGRRDFSNKGLFQDYGFATDDRTISRCHLLFAYINNTFYLADISSRNETLLNGNSMEGCRVESVPNAPLTIPVAYRLENGDHIKVGCEEFVFVTME